MRVTKFVHSCLLVESDDMTVLFDPGVFSWNSKLFDTQKVPKLDAVVITHEHPDHFHKPFVEAIIAKFPDVPFISTKPVVAALQDMGVRQATTEAVPGLEIFSTRRHAELVPLNTAPENIGVHFAGQLSVTGDRHDVTEAVKPILALPMTGPWGSAVDAAAMAIRLKPAHVIPVHDWHWNDEARQMEYDRFVEVLGKHDITFHKTVDGESIEL